MDGSVLPGPEDRGDVRVLHVDDDPAVSDVTATFLEREFDGMTVETETDPTAVTARLDEGAYDCVVSDYEMAEMDGLSLLSSIRNEYPDLPFVLFTGKGSEEIAAEAISAGVTEYLQKDTGTDQYTVLGNRIVNAVDRYRAERARRTLREQYRSLVENAPYGVCIYADGSVVHANESWADLLDAEAPADVEGMSQDEFVADQEASSVEGRIQRVLQDGTAVDWREKEIVTTEGETRTIESSGAPLAHDERPGIQVVARDVSDRARRERELRETKERFRKVFEHSNDAIMLVDLEREAFLEVNSAACEMLGYDADELLALHPADIHPDDIDRVREEFLSQVRSEGEGFTDDLTCLTKDGETVPTEVSGAMLDLDTDVDRPETMVAILRDVSEREAYRDDLERQVDRLEEFTSVVSHDLRNPLNVARGHLDLVRDEFDSEHLQTIDRAHERMEALIEDLLVLAREGQTATDVEPIRLDEVAETCWRTIETTDATLAVETDLTVRADRGRLAQLFENLVRNAVEHGSPDSVRQDPEDGSERDARAFTITVGATEGGFYVSDDGHGIPSDERDRVFEAGYSTADEGTGFGLSIVGRVADAHGWDVTVTESESGGARFEFTGVEAVEQG